MKLALSGAPVRLLALLLLPLAACGARPSGLGGREGEDLHDSGGGPDGDTGDSGTDDNDTDVDTDIDDSGDVDTGADSGLDGAFTLTAVADDATTDTCTGTLALSVDGATVSGVAICSFSGPFSARFPTGLRADVDGSSGDPASGTLRFDGAAVGDVPWTGAATPTAASGTFTGTVSDGSTLTVTGTFSTD
jgi:hypothetical protein